MDLFCTSPSVDLRKDCQTDTRVLDAHVVLIVLRELIAIQHSESESNHLPLRHARANNLIEVLGIVWQ